MSAKSAETFLRRKGRLAQREFSAIKLEVDRLVGCDLNAASRLATRFGELSELIDDPVAKALAGASRARVLDQQGEHSRANSMLQRAAQRMRRAGLKREAANIERQQVHALFSMNRYRDALRVARGARRSLADDPLQLGKLEANVGNIYYRLEQYPRALEHYDRAIAAMTPRDKLPRALVDFNRANILIETDRPREALELLERSASAFERAGQWLQANQCRFHVAYIQFQLGNYNTALGTFYRVRDQLDRLGSRELVAWCNQDIAEMLLALNSFEDAIECASGARTNFTKLGMAYESAQAAQLAALAEMGLDNLERAADYLKDARKLFSRTRNRIQTAVTDCYQTELALKRNDDKTARERAMSALHVFTRNKLHRRSAYARLLTARAEYKLGNLTRSLRLARIALESAKKTHLPSIAYQCHHLMGSIERDRGRHSQARASFRQAVGAVEGLRTGIAADQFKSAFLRDKLQVYEDAIAAALDEGSPDSVEEAFRLVESSKSRALADLLARYASDREPKPKGADLKRRTRLLELIEELNWYNSKAQGEEDQGKGRCAAVAERYRRKVKRCEREVAVLFRRLESETGFSDFARPIEAAPDRELRAALGSRETAIEYFITCGKISAFVVSNDQTCVAREIASVSEVEELLLGLQFQIDKFGYASRYADVHVEKLKQATDLSLLRLYEAIFEPLEMMIATQRLLIIPHGLLHYVPFHALFDGCDYLVDQFEISQAPSAAVLKLCQARARSRISNLKSQTSDRRGDDGRNGRSNLVAIGVVESELPHIADEIRALSDIFPGATSLCGESATRENLLRFGPQARYLHLASHGVFRPDNPMFSFLKLADSRLDFYSLMDLKLDAELVTLSACQTGVNAIFPGDELHGLMRGFLQAGVPSLVVSLWTVNDSSAAEFMKEFYQRLEHGETKRQALRAAHVRIKAERPHPYYWAPFVLIGDPN